jgi:thiamine transport system permease protein
VFAICLTSFAVALTLGGGPRATTLELAIYQAVRFEFDLAHAAGLALVQTVDRRAAALAAWALVAAAGFGAGLDRAPRAAPGGWRRVADAAVLALAAAVPAGPPLAAVLLRGLPGLAELPARSGRRGAVGRGGAGLGAGDDGLALVLALARARAGRAGWRLAAMLPLATRGWCWAPGFS